MPHTPFHLPPFPTAFVEEDVKRLEELEVQRRAMQEAFNVKFSKEAWERTQPLERFARSIIPPQAAGAIGAFPGTAETFEFGFTPEQFQESMQGVEEEYKEITRRQKVTGLLPNIQTGIVMAALRGDPITSTSDLMAIFPELRSDFIEEEVNYLARLSQVISRATPEQIISGELFASEPGQLPISEEDIRAFFPEGAQDPRFIQATVSFSKDLEEVTQALKDAYPAEGVGEEDSAEARAKIEEYFRQQAIEQGVILEGEGKDALQKAHEEIARDAGELLTLRDDTGALFTVKKKQDGSVWSIEDNTPIGYWDEDSGTVVPMSPIGEPLIAEENKESLVKNLWDAFLFSLIGLGHRVEQAIKYTYPASILDQMKRQIDPEGYNLTPGKFFAEFSPGLAAIAKSLDDDTKRALVSAMETQLEDMKQDYTKRKEDYLVWVEENPDLKPPPEWVIDTEELGMVDTVKRYGNKILTTPSFVGYMMADNAATIMAFAATMGVAYGTKNPYLTIGVASALFAPIETQDLFEDLIASGASEELALAISPKAGALIAAIEGLGSLPIVKAVSPGFFSAWRKNVSSHLIRRIITISEAQGIRGGLAQAGRIQIAELSEEFLQEVLHNAFVQTVDENRALLENVPEVMIRATFSILPLAGFGGGVHYRAMRNNLPPDVQKDLDADIKRAVELGASLVDAQRDAVVNLMQTETGQAQVLEAGEKAEDEVLEVPEVVPEAIVPKRTTNLENKLESYNKEIETMRASIKVQDANLAKTTMPADKAEQQESIDNLNEIIEELEKDKALVQKKLNNAMEKERVKTEVSTQVPTTIEEAVEIPQTEAVDNTTVSRQYISSWIHPDLLLPTKRPRALDWDDEQAGVERALQDPKIAKEVKIPPKIRETREVVKNTINTQQDEYITAKNAKDKEAIKDVETTLKVIAKKAGLKANAILGKRWDDIPPEDRLKLTVSVLPEGSLNFLGVREFFDMEYFMQFLEEMTGAPFYSILVRVENANAVAETAKELILQRITRDSYFKEIRTDEKALDRVSQEINARNELEGIEHPDNITENEMLLADAIEEIYNYYKPIVRYLRVTRTKSDIESFKDEFPDAVDKGKIEELELAIKIKEEGSLDDLWGYLFPLEWGVIEHGFDPRFIAHPGLKISRRGGLRITRGKKHLMRREKIEYPAGKQSKNVLARLASYVEAMEI